MIVAATMRDTKEVGGLAGAVEFNGPFGGKADSTRPANLCHRSVPMRDFGIEAMP